MFAELALKKSYIYYSYLLLFEGLSLLIFPHLITKLLFLSPLQTAQAVQYTRTTGAGIGIIGYYYYVAGKYSLIDFFRASVVGRFFALPLMVILVYVWSIEYPFIIFGIQDAISAYWSYTCLKAYDAEKAKTNK